MIALFAASALAHPFHNQFYGHELAVEARPDALRVDYVAEIPTRALWNELRAVEREGKPTDAFAKAREAELLAGLSVAVDGARPSLTPLPTEPPKVDEKFTKFHLAFEVPLDPAVPHRVELGNANAPEELAYFRASTRVARAWRVTGCSLVGEDGVWDGQWRLDERGRRVTLDLAPRSGPSAWVLAVHPDRDGSRAAAVALETSTFDELGETWVPVVGFGAAVAGIGVVAWRRKPA